MKIPEDSVPALEQNDSAQSDESISTTAFASEAALPSFLTPPPSATLAANCRIVGSATSGSKETASERTDRLPTTALKCLSWRNSPTKCSKKQDLLSSTCERVHLHS